MSSEPATADSYFDLSLDQMIGLFLAKLYGWLTRCHESGAPFAPADIAQNVNKADALVHAFIRSRAAAQLEHAGYTDAAHAMRDTPEMRAPGCHTELSSGAHGQAALSTLYANEKFARANENALGAAGPSSRGTPASTQNELAQGCAPYTPAELLERLETIIAQFQRAEAIGCALARMVVYTLSVLTPEMRKVPVYTPPKRQEGRVDFSPPTLFPMGRGPPHIWPPPTHTVIPCAVRGAVTLRQHGTFFEPSHTRSRISIAQLRYATHPG